MFVVDGPRLHARWARAGDPWDGILLVDAGAGLTAPQACDAAARSEATALLQQAVAPCLLGSDLAPVPVRSPSSPPESPPRARPDPCPSVPPTRTQTAFLPALAGWLLGYPAVYWPRRQRDADSGTRGGNCLGQVPLRVAAVAYQAPSGVEHTVLQYSVPAALTADVYAVPAALTVDADAGVNAAPPGPWPEAPRWRPLGVRWHDAILPTVLL